MKTRLDGEGTISWDATRQRYIVAVSVDGKRPKVSCKTESEAVKVLQELRRKYGLIKYSGSMKFGEWYEEWLFEVKAHSLKTRSIADYKNVYDKHIKPYPIAQMGLSEITKMDVTKHFNALAKDGRSIQTIKKVKLRMSAAFNAADDYIEKNPVKYATLPRAKDNTRVYHRKMEVVNMDNVFSKVQQQSLTAALGSDWYCDFLLFFILGSGLRIGEALALNYIDVDLEAATVRINKAVQRTPVIVDRKVTKYERKVDTPKTENSVRTIPIPAVLVTGVRRRIAEIKAEDPDLFTDNGLLFPNEFGDYLNDRRVLRRLNALEIALKLPKINVHGLRHSYATRLLEAGKPIQTISKLLGHANVELTQGIYAHVMDSLKEDAIGALDGILSDYA